MTMLMQVVVVMGMLVGVFMGVGMLMGVGNTVVGVLMGMGMLMGVVMISTQSVVVSKMHSRCSFAFFFIIPARDSLVNFLKAVTGIQKPHQGIVGLIIGKQACELLFYSQRLQRQI